MRYSALALVLAFTSSLLLSGCPAVVATGVGAGVVAAEDRRTLATQAEDTIRPGAALTDDLLAIAEEDLRICRRQLPAGRFPPHPFRCPHIAGARF